MANCQAESWEAFRATECRATGLQAHPDADRVVPAISATGSTTYLDRLEQMPDHLAGRSVSAIGRRAFLKAGLAVPLAARVTSLEGQQQLWRAFEIRVRVDVVAPRGSTRLWLPLLLSRPSPFQRTIAQEWSGNAQTIRVVDRAAQDVGILEAIWVDHSATPQLSLVMKVATTGHQVPLETTDSTTPLAPADRARYLAATALIPTDGLVLERATQITRAHRTPLARARAIYEWIVENTFRDPAVKGCGTGDIRWMLESGSLGGKCADLNALFVGLCRAIGLPARDLYGIRVAESSRFKSLGRAGDITSAQHCRAEVFIERIGWVPVDPADVRKVVLEERPGATLDDRDVRRARELLFGSWEMNWVAFNDGHDLRLPGSTGKPLPYFMYPQLEVNGVRRDSLDPAAFRYQITVVEIPSP